MSAVALLCLIVGAYTLWLGVRAAGDAGRGPMMIGGLIFALGGIFTVAVMLDTLSDKKPAGTEPIFRRAPSEAEIAGFRELNARMHAAVAEAKAADSLKFDFLLVELNLSHEHLNAADVLRDPADLGYRRLSAELTLPGFTAPFTRVAEAANELANYHENFPNVTPPKPRGRL